MNLAIIVFLTTSSTVAYLLPQGYDRVSSDSLRRMEKRAGSGIQIPSLQAAERSQVSTTSEGKYIMERGSYSVRKFAIDPPQDLTNQSKFRKWSSNSLIRRGGCVGKTCSPPPSPRRQRPSPRQGSPQPPEIRRSKSIPVTSDLSSAINNRGTTLATHHSEGNHPAPSRPSLSRSGVNSVTAANLNLNTIYRDPETMHKLPNSSDPPGGHQNSRRSLANL